MKDKYFLLRLVIVVLFVGLLVWAIVRNLNQEPEITVYEEVCRNETQYKDYASFMSVFWYIEDARIDLDDKYSYCKVLYPKNKYLEGCEDYNAILEALESKQDEVIKAREESITIIEVCKPEIVVADNVIEWCYSEDDCGKIKIGEEPWVIDWIDENCEVQKGECLKWNERIGELSICKEEIKKYKCGKYIVEVTK